MPYRPRTEKQQEALTKARAALQRKYTCERCGGQDPSRGLQKQADYRIVNVAQDGVTHRYCLSCRLYFRWIDKRQRIEQQMNTIFAANTAFLIVDCETTGTLLHRNCQIVEITVINQDGKVLYHSLCKPDIPMPHEASEINGLTDEMLADAPTFSDIWLDLVTILTEFDGPIYAWNADFDHEMLLRTAKRFGLQVPVAIIVKERWHCVMKLHAQWYGEWSNGKHDYRWQPLEWACTDLQIETSEYHRATSDAQNTLRVMRALAGRAGKNFPPPPEMPYFDYVYE